MEDLKEGQNWPRSAMTISQDFFRKLRKNPKYFGTMAIGQAQFHKLETDPKRHSGSQPTSTAPRFTKMITLLRRSRLTNQRTLKNTINLFLRKNHNLG
jgi:hypothetical protein